MVKILEAASLTSDLTLAISTHVTLTHIVRWGFPNSVFELELETYEHLRTRMANLRDLLSDLGLDVSAQIVEECLSALAKGANNGTKITFEGQSLHYLTGPFNQITSIIGREIKSRTCLILSRNEQELINFSSPPFGEDVFNAFSSAREDIEEASKCLGYSRNTAAVFHIMRALESATHVVASKLGAAITDAHGKGLGWGVIAQNMKSKIDSLPKGSSEQITWYRVQQNLEAVNRAWRVPTNHPKETYTDEQAREVFITAKAFMRELSAFC